MNTFANVPEYPAGRHEGRGAAQLRHALFESPGSISPRSRWSSRSPTRAGATTCCRCSTCGPTCSRRPAGARPAPRRGNFADRAAGLERRRLPAGRHADRRADALCLDHRPHQDRRAAGLRRGPQDPGGLQDHAAVATGARPPSRSTATIDPTVDMKTPPKIAGRHHAGRQVLRLCGRADEAAPAARHRRADPRADEADRHRAGQELRLRQGSTRRSRRRSRARRRTPRS